MSSIFRIANDMIDRGVYYSVYTYSRVYCSLLGYIHTCSLTNSGAHLHNMAVVPGPRKSEMKADTIERARESCLYV